MIIEFFNGISNLLLSRAALALPSQDVGDLNLGSNILFLILWLLILILILKSFTRLVQIIILIGCAPLAGALLMDRTTSSRFRSWFEKLLELLLAQINLAILFVVITAILQPYQGRGAGDAFISMLLAIVMMGLALSGRSVIGIAGSALGSGGGGSVLAFLKYQVVGGAVRGALGGRGRSGAAGGGASIGTALPAAASSRSASGDPAQSAAAQRQMDRSSAPFLRRADENSSGLSEPARRRAADSATRQPPDSARREQALTRATLMKQRAGVLREGGNQIGAATLARKARLHERFGRGQDIARPSRFSAAERATRRQTYRNALSEAVGMHALERDALTQQIGSDEAQLPVVQRELALTASTGGDATTLHREQQDIERRLATSRARMQVISPREQGMPAPATRAAAAALANERLAPDLRSSAYRARIGATEGSAFARRITNAATQDARDELAQTRAHAVRVAQTPTERRAPIAPPRKRSVAGKQTERGIVMRPPRMRSTTIDHLRRARHDQAHMPETHDDEGEQP
jgi:hypothetical protein